MTGLFDIEQTAPLISRNILSPISHRERCKGI